MANTPYTSTGTVLRSMERAYEVLPVPIAAVVAQYMRTTASIKTVPEDNERRLRRVEELARTIMAMPVPVTEHAIEMSGGGMHVRNPDPEIERVYPLARWIPDHQRFGGSVRRRRIVVIEDWTEVGQ